MATYRIKFQAHNIEAWNETHVPNNIEAVYQLVCALNYTGFSYTVYQGDADVTDAFENRMAADLDKPVTRVAGYSNLR